MIPASRSRREAAARDLAVTGAPDAPIEIVDYDAHWPALFERERRRLVPLLPGAVIHHIGSTAVPGLPGKAIIDLIALVEDLDSPIRGLVEHGGYQYPEAFNAELRARRWLCRPSAAQLKREFAQRFGDDREGYSAAKSEFVQRVQA